MTKLEIFESGILVHGHTRKMASEKIYLQEKREERCYLNQFATPVK